MPSVAIEDVAARATHHGPTQHSNTDKSERLTVAIAEFGIVN